MCSFIFVISNKDYGSKEINTANNYLKSRGPDKTNLLRWKSSSKNVLSIHNLLDISGSTIVQPIKNDQGKSLLFNGEIYLPKNKKVPDTLRLFENFVENKIDKFLMGSIGEFAISAFDEKLQKIFLYRDLIGTKPLFYGLRKDAIAVSSYSGALKLIDFENIFEVSPNTKTQIDISFIENPKIINQNLYPLNLEQNNPNLDEWNKKFLQSVEVRAKHFKSKFFVPLSSGYDSGAICCALNLLEIPYVTVSIGDYEDQQILEKRININLSKSCKKHFNFNALTPRKCKQISKFLYERLGDIKYDHIDDQKMGEPNSLHQDPGAIGMAFICEEMKKKEFNTLLTGTGADEIISDYGFNGIKIASHSEFGGLFPDNLENFFPWKKFYDDSQKSYLRKDEMVAGLFGIEGRYPYLDKELIQSFLNLDVSLKNKRYKHCILSFLEMNDYPVEVNVKKGFSPFKTKMKLREKIFSKLYKFFNKI